MRRTDNGVPRESVAAWRGFCSLGRLLGALGIVMTQTANVAAQQPSVADNPGGNASVSLHPYGAWSLVPPLLAIGLAMATRRVILSLLTGVVVGVVIQTAMQDVPKMPVFASAVWMVGVVSQQTCEGILWPNLTNGDLLRVFAFSMTMGAMIGVMYASGGMHGLVRILTPLASNRRRGQLTGWGMGLAVFFDDYANTLLLGNTLRPVADRLRISREKLAYIVDSTAAPVAGLAIISTWVATEIQYIQEGFSRLGLPEGSYQGMTVFIETIPYRFYPLLALFFVALVAMTGRDFGPMLRVERRLARGDSDPGMGGDYARDPNEIMPPAGIPQRWFNALLPLMVVIGTMLALMLATGRGGSPDEPPANWREAFNSGNSYLALVYAALAGLLTSIGLARAQRLLDGGQIRVAASYGARLVIPALAILWLSACLKDVTGNSGLQTAEYVGRWLEGAVSSIWLPTLAFVLAAGVALATGTSWGTMGILLPLVIGAAYVVLRNEAGALTLDAAVGSLAGVGTPATWLAVSPYEPVLLATVGSVLAGAIFGDHCSPISDTTVLSSMASGCNHFSHVWTQMPYALVVGVVSILAGTLPVGLGMSPGIMLGIAALILVGWIYLVGRRAEDDDALPKPGQ